MKEETKNFSGSHIGFLLGVLVFSSNSRPMIFQPYFLSWRISIIPPVSCFDLGYQATRWANMLNWIAKIGSDWNKKCIVLRLIKKKMREIFLEEDLRWLVGWRLLKQHFARCLFHKHVHSYNQKGPCYPPCKLPAIFLGKKGVTLYI